MSAEAGTDLPRPLRPLASGAASCGMHPGADAPHGGSDAVLKAIGFTATRFLHGDCWRGVMPEVLARLGDALGVDRVRLMELREDAGGAVLHETYGWAAAGMELPPADGALPSIRCSDLGEGWVEKAFRRGEPLALCPGTVSPGHAAVLAAQGIRTLAAVPVAVDGEWWGVLAFHSCRGEREWGGCELEALRTAGGLLAGAVHRERVERALRERERQLAEAQAVARVGSWEWEVGTGVVSWSDEHYRILGLDPERFQPSLESFLERLHPHDRGRVTDLVWEGALGEGFEYESRFVRPDGEVRHLSSRGRVVERWKGRPVRVVGTAQDVTERRQAEEALRCSERQFRELADNIGAVFWLWDRAEERILYANAAFDEIWGVEAAAPERLTTAWAGRLHPEDRERVLASRDRLHQGDFQHEYRILRPDGEVRWILDRSFPIHDDQGKPYRTAGIAEDITEQRRAAEALRESERSYRALFDGLGELVYIQDLQGRFLNVNQAVLRAYGYTAQEILGRTPELVVSAEHTDMERLNEAFRRAVAGEPMQREVWGRRRDGSVFPKEITVTRATYFGQPVVIAVARDITERKQAEEALRERDEQLLQAQKMEAVGRLAGGVAHDFNNLLTVIGGRAQMLLLEMEGDDPHQEDVREIAQAAERSATLTRQLLAFSRKQILQPRVLDLSRVTADLQRLLARTLGEDVQVVARAEPELWHVSADPGQVEQVLLNLAVNARDAMPQGGTLTLTVRNRRLDDAPGAPGGDYVELAVADTGCGMDAEVQARVFEPFYTTKPVGKGTGLGLSTVYGIVQQSGGRVELESAPGAGSTFRILLPRTTDSSAPDPCPAAAPAAAAARGGTVLLAEDDDAVRALVRETLTRAGYRVLFARTPAEALLLCEQAPHGIDVLVTDVVMPRMSGPALADAARRLRPGLPVLFISGYAGEALANHGVRPEGVRLLAKPFRPQELLARVAEVIGAG